MTLQQQSQGLISLISWLTPSQLGTHGMIMSKPVMDPAMYAQQSHAYMAQKIWPQAPDQQPSPSDH